MLDSITASILSWHICIFVMISGFAWRRKQPKFWKLLWSGSMNNFTKTCFLHTLLPRVNCGLTLHRWTTTQRSGRKRWAHFLSGIEAWDWGSVACTCCSAALPWDHLCGTLFQLLYGDRRWHCTFQVTTQGLSVPHMMCLWTEGISVTAGCYCGVFRDYDAGYKTANLLTYLLPIKFS